MGSTLAEDSKFGSSPQQCGLEGTICGDLLEGPCAGGEKLCSPVGMFQVGRLKVGSYLKVLQKRFSPMQKDSREYSCFVFVGRSVPAEAADEQ